MIKGDRDPARGKLSQGGRPEEGSGGKTPQLQTRPLAHAGQGLRHRPKLPLRKWGLAAPIFKNGGHRVRPDAHRCKCQPGKHEIAGKGWGKGREDRGTPGWIWKVSKQGVGRRGVGVLGATHLTDSLNEGNGTWVVGGAGGGRLENETKAQVEESMRTKETKTQRKLKRPSIKEQ